MQGGNISNITTENCKCFPRSKNQALKGRRLLSPLLSEQEVEVKILLYPSLTALKTRLFVAGERICIKGRTECCGVENKNGVVGIETVVKLHSVIYFTAVL
jgi:hypothetical protein